MRDIADTKCHEACLESDRLRILLSDLQNRFDLQFKTAQNTENDLREKIETLRNDMQSQRVAAMEASAAAAEEVSRGHEVRQRLIDDLAKSNARVKELETENKDLLEATLQQDKLLHCSMNESIELGHQVMENDIALASINEKQQDEIRRLNNSIDIQAESIRSSSEEIERRVAEKFIEEAEDLQARNQELERSNKLLEFEKAEYLKDMTSTMDSIQEMESRLSNLIKENATLKSEIKSKQRDFDTINEQSIVISDSSLKSIVNFEAKVSRGNQEATDVLGSPDIALLKISDHSRPREKTSVRSVGRLESLEKFIETLHGRQDSSGDLSSKKVVFNIDSLIRCLMAIKQESEEMSVHATTVATTSLLRQMRNRKGSKSASVKSSTDSAKEIIDVPKVRHFPGNVTMSVNSDSDSDEVGSPSNTKLNKSTSFRMFSKMDSNDDGFISLSEFVKAVRKYKSIGKVFRIICDKCNHASSIVGLYFLRL